MKTNYVLIDFENIQPKNLEKLAEFGFKVVVFVGANQTKVPFELANAMQMLGSDGEYVKVEGNGQNALDFHIACYIGSLSTKNPDAYFSIISKDTGFDPLIKHLRSRKIMVQRQVGISDIPVLRIEQAKSIDERLMLAINFLKERQNSKPATIKTLLSSISSLFFKNLQEQEIAGIVDEMVARKIVVKNGNKVTYNLSAEAKALPGPQLKKSTADFILKQ